MNHDTSAKNRMQKNDRKKNWMQTRRWNSKEKNEWKKIHHNMCLVSIQVSGIYFIILFAVEHISYSLLLKTNAHKKKKKRIKLPMLVAPLFIQIVHNPKPLKCIYAWQWKENEVSSRPTFVLNNVFHLYRSPDERHFSRIHSALSAVTICSSLLNDFINGEHHMFLICEIQMLIRR